MLHESGFRGPGKAWCHEIAGIDNEAFRNGAKEGGRIHCLSPQHTRHQRRVTSRLSKTRTCGNVS